MSGEQHGPHGAWRTAARYGDADAEEHGLMAAVRKQGIDPEEFLHVADQRALRVVLQQRAGFHPAMLSGSEVQAVALDPIERDVHRVFVAAYMDGLYIGWRARGLVDAGDE